MTSTSIAPSEVRLTGVLPVISSYDLRMAETLDISKLTTKERLDLIGELWDSIAPEDVRLTAAQDAELGRRMATLAADAKTAVPWEETETELDRRSR